MDRRDFLTTTAGALGAAAVARAPVRGAALTDKRYRPFFEEANRMKLCIFLHPMIFGGNALAILNNV